MDFSSTGCTSINLKGAGSSEALSLRATGIVRSIRIVVRGELRGIRI